MKLPLNITLAMLSGCASWDPGVTGCVGTRKGGVWEGRAHQKFPHTPTQTPSSPSTPAPPHYTHSHSLPLSVHDKFLGSQYAMQPGSPVPRSLQWHGAPLHSLHHLYPTPISAMLSLLHSLVYSSVSPEWGGGSCSAAFRGKEGE